MKNLKKFTSLLSVIAFSLFIASCGSGEHPGFEKAEDGLYYQIHTLSEDTQIARVGDLIAAKIEFRSTEDSIFNKIVNIMPVLENSYQGDIYSAFRMLHPGDSATFIVSVDSFFSKIAQGTIPEFLDSGSFFYADMSVDSIITAAELEVIRAEETKMMKAMEVEKISSFLASNNFDIQPDVNGLYFIPEKEGKGSVGEPGKYAVIHMVAQVIGERPFENTYEKGAPIEYPIGTGRLGQGFEQGLLKMKEGGKARIVCPSSLAFGENGISRMIPPYAPMLFEVEIIEFVDEATLKARKEKEMEKSSKEEEIKRNAYLQKEGITVAPTQTGLYFIEKVAGSGAQAVAGKKVKVHYTGRLLDGTVFDSSVDRGQPIEFPLGVGQVIPGWDEGIAMMKVGGKATLVIPSNIAYGPAGSGPIPPSSTLVFDVELIEVISE